MRQTPTRRVTEGMYVVDINAVGSLKMLEEVILRNENLPDVAQLRLLHHASDLAGVGEEMRGGLLLRVWSRLLGVAAAAGMCW